MGFADKLAALNNAAKNVPVAPQAPSNPPPPYTPTMPPPPPAVVPPYMGQQQPAVPPTPSTPGEAVQQPQNTQPTAPWCGTPAAPPTPWCPPPLPIDPIASMGPYSGQVLEKLTRIVQHNGLQRFYGPQQLQQIAGALGQKDFARFAETWGLNAEIATDLASLALYDVVIYADNSGSMDKAMSHDDRWKELHAIFESMVNIVSFFGNRLDIRFFNTTDQQDIYGVSDPNELVERLKGIQPRGITPMGTNLQRKILNGVLAKAQRGALQKPVLVLTITDGAPQGESKYATASAILNTQNRLLSCGYSAAGVAFGFAKVGKDEAATEFLDGLMEDKRFGGHVDVTEDFETEQEEWRKEAGLDLSAGVYLTKLLVGAVDPEYGEHDQGIHAPGTN